MARKHSVCRLGDSLDLVPIGGFHGKGKRAGVFGAFLLACYDEGAEEYQSICKVGTGFTEVILEERSRSLREHMREAPAAYYRCADSMQVDVWFDPCQVWEVRAADLSISPVHRAAAGIVDPTKVRDRKVTRAKMSRRADEGCEQSGFAVQGIALRFPRFLRVRDDKTPELATTAEQVGTLASSVLVGGFSSREHDTRTSQCIPPPPVSMGKEECGSWVGVESSVMMVSCSVFVGG